VTQRIGVDHVGFGSDFDGADMPTAIRDASFFQDLVQALRDKGYQGEDVEKIAYKNWLRVLRSVWR
jgi:membrane dipeptidase